MKQLLSLFFIFCFAALQAQEVKYTYDASGNRTKRKLYVSGPSPLRLANNDSIAKHAAEGMQTAMQEGISVFPNPTDDVVNVTINNFKTDEKVVAQLMDNNGKILKTQIMQSSSVQFAVAELQSGIYYINVIKGKEKLYYKVVKQ